MPCHHPLGEILHLSVTRNLRREWLRYLPPAFGNVSAVEPCGCLDRVKVMLVADVGDDDLVEAVLVLDKILDLVVDDFGRCDRHGRRVKLTHIDDEIPLWRLPHPSVAGF